MKSKMRQTVSGDLASVSLAYSPLEAAQYDMRAFIAQVMIDAFTPNTAAVAQKLRLWVEFDVGGTPHELPPPVEVLVSEAGAVSLSFVLLHGNWSAALVKADVVDLDGGDTYSITLCVVEV